ncbi:MAG: HD domain-containing protein [Nitrospirae bacterium]|nr:HD domain-containing protein [Nitrospirota bacterium]
MEPLREKVHKYGRTIISNFCALVRMTGLYDAMNETVLNAAKRLISSLEFFLGDKGELNIKMVEGSFYIEGVRIRAGVSDIENFTYLAEEFKKRSIGVLSFKVPLQADDLIYLAYAIKGGAEATSVQSALEGRLTKGLSVGGPVFLQKQGGIDLKDSQAVAKQAYLKAVSAMKELDTSIKAGHSPNLKKVKKSIQSIVDRILSDEECILGFTTIKDVPNYSHYHSVNVAILSTAIGKRIGLNRTYLSKLAMTAFFHDIGKVNIPLSILNKETDFVPKEKELLRRHPIEGIKILLKLLGLDETSILSIFVSFEHHMKLNLSGYPQTSTGRKLNIFSRIISIADDYDSYVSGKVYERRTLSVEEALTTMYNASGTLYDPSLMKAFVEIFR